MTWDNSIFNKAFDRVGLREKVVVVDSPLLIPEFRAKFERPQRIFAEDQVHTTDYAVEYTTSDAPGLCVGTVLDIGEGGVLGRYRVIQPPLALDDGFWSNALLEAVS
jgi:hypothetical protein